MDILSYLSELIQTRKAVGVSGLGTVYKKKLPGRYDAETHSFIPPSYTIDFTPEIKEEIILAEFISKKSNVSNDIANYFIDEFSNGILQQLNDHQEANFGDLGKLYKADDELRFEPSEKLNYGFDFYGLPIVKAEQEPSAEEIMPETPSVEEHIEHIEEPVIAPVQEPAIETVVPDHENFIPDSPILPRKDEKQLRAEIEALNFYRSKSPVAKTTTPEQEEVIWNIKDNPKTTEPAQFYNKNEEVYTPEEEEEVTKTTPLYIKIILGLLILVIMMIIAYMVKPEWFNGIIANNSFNTPKTEQPVKQPIQVRYKSVPATAQPIKKDSVIQNAVNATDTATVYEVMAASMHNQREANKFIEQMKKSGINAKVVTNMSGRKLKISIATLKDNESAKIELERLTRKLKIPGMYIYKNKQ